MPPKPEYWVLSPQQFHNLKSYIDSLGEKIFHRLKQHGFDKIESQRDWLGLTVNRNEDRLLTLVSFSLIRESPIEFELILRRWNKSEPSKTCVNFYRKSFNSIEEVENTIDLELNIISEKLKKGL